MRGIPHLTWGLVLAGTLSLATACSTATPAPGSGGGAGTGGGGGAGTGGGGQSQQAPAAPAGPQFGGIAVMPQRGAPETMNTLAGGATDTSVPFGHFNEALFRVDARVDYRIDYPIVPALAEKWESSADAKVWTFQIRNGVKWHDGVDLTAEGVVASMNLVRDAKNGYTAQNQYKGIESVAAEPGNKVKVTFSQPAPLTLQRSWVIYPSHVFEKGGKQALDYQMVGTGPFKLENMDRTSRTTFKKFENYWAKDDQGKQLPYLDGLQFIHNMDASAQLAAFAAKQADFQVMPDKAQLEAFTKRVSDLKVTKFQYSSDPGLMINLKKPYLDKLEVRQALNLIIDRHDMNQNFAGGDALLSLPAVPAMKTGYTITQEELMKRPGFGTDKAKDWAEAKRLLAAAGVPADHEFDIMNHATYSTGPATEIAVNQFRKFGLKVKYRPMDDAAVTRETRAGTFDLSHELHASDNLTTRAYDFYHSKSVANGYGINDPEIDRLTEALQATADPEKLKPLAKQLQTRILDMAYTIPEVSAPLYTVTQPWINGYNNFGIQPAFSNGIANYVWIDKDKLPQARK